MAKEKRLIDADMLHRRLQAFIASVRYKGVDNVPTGKDTSSATEFLNGYERGAIDAANLIASQPVVNLVDLEQTLSSTPGLGLKDYQVRGILCAVKRRILERREAMTKVCAMCGCPYVGASCPNCGSKEVATEDE